MKVVYIAGYGRSGSTILDIMLGDQPNIVSLGEVVYLYEDVINGLRTCSCGCEYETCELWGEVINSVELDRHREIVRKVESRKNLPSLLANTLAEDTKVSYRKHSRSLFRKIADTSGSNVIVDSSKSARDAAGRFWALSNIAGLDVFVLHLVRDARSTVRSVVSKGRNPVLEGHGEEKQFPGLRTAFGWMLSNTTALCMGKMMPSNRYLRVRYENLRENYESEISRISEFIGENIDNVVEQISNGKSFRVHHNTGGNRVRLNREVQFRTSSSQSSRDELPARYEIAVTLVGGWLLRYFGYDLF
jgi:hypothetical protein